MSNGNQQPPIEIDVTDEHAFRTGVVQYIQIIADRTYCLPELKKKVDKHESIVNVGKYASVPALAFLHAGLRHLFGKLGM